MTQNRPAIVTRRLPGISLTIGRSRAGLLTTLLSGAACMALFGGICWALFQV